MWVVAQLPGREDSGRVVRPIAELSLYPLRLYNLAYYNQASLKMNNTLTEAQRQQLNENGFTILPRVLSNEQLAALNARLEELWLEEGDQAGHEVIVEPGVRRLANLINKGEIFRPLFTNLLLLEAIEIVLGPKFRLGSLNARAIPPHTDPKMPWHADTDYGGKPDIKGFYSLTVIWMLDDFTAANGGTHIVPGSHRSNAVPKETMDDIYAPHPDELIVEGQAGDVLVMNGHCWHTGGANTTTAQRRALLGHYNRADHRQQTNQQVMLSPQVQAQMNPLEREILGLNDWKITRIINPHSPLGRALKRGLDQLRTTKQRLTQSRRPPP
jgi:ectoine hydroxylase-related dioxygenase (phytanoyl-CoA dioxygenase family)